ncbi:MAG: CopG family transcriptional regulator [Campylobacterota bacterium]|nr:CopG family transcriptional regulator [Campylobacterota bacterium]
MISLRLEKNLEKELTLISKLNHQTKTDTIKKALKHYFKSLKTTTPTAYELGEEYFGKYGSTDGNLSTTYKQKLKDRINAKNHYR